MNLNVEWRREDLLISKHHHADKKWGTKRESHAVKGLIAVSLLIVVESGLVFEDNFGVAQFVIFGNVVDTVPGFSGEGCTADVGGSINCAITRDIAKVWYSTVVVFNAGNGRVDNVKFLLSEGGDTSRC